jgi:hypothetical protein
MRIHAAAMDIAHRTAVPPKQLRAHPAVAFEWQRAAMEEFGSADMGHFGPRGAMIPDYFDTRPHVLGMSVETDPWLPPDMFRLCDEDGTLLYDSREGTSAL